MARFFREMGEPVSFKPVTDFGGGGSVSRSQPAAPTAEDKKRTAMTAAYNGSMVDVSPKSMPAEKVAEGMEGMTVNVPQTGDMQSDPNKYYENLTKMGYGDLASQEQERQVKIEQDETVLSNTKLKSYAEHTRASLSLAAAGDLQGAIRTANQVHAPGERITSIQPIDKHNFMVFSEDKPEGQPVNALEIDEVLSTAEKRMDRYFPLQIKAVGDKLIGTQRHMLTDAEDVKFTIDNPIKKRDNLTPFEQETQRRSAEAYVNSVAEDKKVEQRAARLDDATSAFQKFLKTNTGAMMGTGSRFNIPGTLMTNADAQALDRTFKALNLDEMVSAFQGMARAIDSDAERAFFEQKQPAMTNQTEVNAQILTATYALTAKQKADNAAMREYVGKNQTMVGYVSPVVGKQTALFNGKTGEVVLVSREDAPKYQKQGYKTTDEYAKALLIGAPVPKAGVIKSLNTSTPTVTSKEEFERLPSGTEYINSKGQRARKP